MTKVCSSRDKFCRDKHVPDRHASRTNCGAICFRAGLVSLAGAATNIIFVTSFVTTKVCSPRQNFLCQWQNTSFVATKWRLSWQKYLQFCLDKRRVLSQQKTRFVATNMFVATEMILVAVPANDTNPAPKQMAPQFVRDYTTHAGLTHRRWNDRKKELDEKQQSFSPSTAGSLQLS